MNHELLAALVIAAVTPVLAWLAWVLPAGGAPSDTQHVLWFITVAAGVLAAGLLTPDGRAAAVATSTVAIISTMTTLYLWWASEDSTGLFLVGILMALPAVALAGPALVVTGRGLRSDALARVRSAAGR